MGLFFFSITITAAMTVTVGNTTLLFSFMCIQLYRKRRKNDVVIIIAFKKYIYRSVCLCVHEQFTGKPLGRHQSEDEKERKRESIRFLAIIYHLYCR